MSTHVGWRRWSALPTVTALLVAVALTACSDASSGPLGVDDSQLAPTSGTMMSDHTVGTTGANTTDLIAGQNEDVGDVTITDDGSQLTVEIVMEDDWCLTEVHIAAADTEDNIPQNKKGNPVPGHFEINESPDCTSGGTWSLGLPDDSDGDGIVVAVHTVVLGPEQTMWVYSNGTETYLANTGPGTTAFTGECTNTTADRTGTAAFAWEPPDDTDPSLWDSQVDHAFSSSADWIWESYRVLNPVCGDVVEFTRSFDVPGHPTGGTLWSTADNGHEAWVNGTETASNGLSGDWKNSDLGASFVLIQGWQDVQESDLAGLLTSGSNQFVFRTANEYMNADDGDDSSAGTISSNPAGLIYEASITYRAPEETAWAEGTEFPFEGNGKGKGGGNWGMYIDYQPTACPAVTSSSKVDLLDAPLDDVRAGENTADDPQVFAESALADHGGFTLDISPSNGTNADGDPDGFPVADGVPVCSYYVHFDDGEPGDSDSVTDASLTFESEILGLIVAGTTNSSDIFHQEGLNTLCDTDASLGNDGTDYEPTASCGIDGDARGLEIFNTDPTLGTNQDPIAISGSTVQFSPTIHGKHDSFRIILPGGGVIVPPEE